MCSIFKYLYLGLLHKDAVSFIASEVLPALDGSVILAFCFIQDHTYPLASSKKAGSNVCRGGLLRSPPRGSPLAEAGRLPPHCQGLRAGSGPHWPPEEDCVD